MLKKLSTRYIAALGMMLLSAKVMAEGPQLPPFTAEQPGYVVDQKLEDSSKEIQDILQNQASQISQQTNAIKNMNVSVNAGLTGETGIGGEINTAAEQSFNNWTPTAQDLTNMVQEGLQTGSLADQVKYYNEKFRIPSTENIPEQAKTMADYNVFSAVSTNGALVIADKGFSNAADIVRQINFLYRQIDQQKTVKESMDLNSAILLKIASLQVDLIRLQSQQLKMQSVSQQKNNSEYAFMTQFVKDVE